MKTAQWKRHIGQSQRKCETWNFGFLFPGCHGQLCVPSTNVPAVSTCRLGSSLQAPCPAVLVGLHLVGMIDCPYSWSQAQTTLEVQLILQDQNPHPESHCSGGPNFLLWIRQFTSISGCPKTLTTTKALFSVSIFDTFSHTLSEKTTLEFREQLPGNKCKGQTSLWMRLSPSLHSWVAGFAWGDSPVVTSH